jgi:acyl transferase domain-containing protein
MGKRTVFLFSGQGSQYYQMGRQLYEQDRAFRLHMDWMDTLVHDVSGRSVLAELYGAKSKAERFDAIGWTHPAIFMVEYALARSVIARGIQPDVCLGTSLGTLTALAAAGRARAEHVLEMLVRQAALLELAGPGGAMVAVMADARQVMTDVRLTALACVAADHGATHFVLATPTAEVEAVLAILRASAIPYQVLPVRYPFHSPWIEPLRTDIVANMLTLPVRHAPVDVWCCARKDMLGAWTADSCWAILRAPIALARTIERLEEDGPCDYLDLGPGGTLHTALKYLLPSRAAGCSRSVLAPFGSDAERLARLTPVA